MTFDMTDDVTDIVMGSTSLNLHYTVDSERDRKHGDTDGWPITGHERASYLPVLNLLRQVNGSWHP